MLERGLVPEFSPAEMAEAQHLDGGIGPLDPAIRDLRGLLVGVDRQRRFARSRSAHRRRGAAVRVDAHPGRDRGRRRQGQAGLRAGSPRRDQHDVGLHRRADVPDAARAALDRPHLAQRGARAAGAGDRASWSARTVRPRLTEGQRLSRGRRQQGQAGLQRGGGLAGRHRARARQGDRRAGTGRQPAAAGSRRAGAAAAAAGARRAGAGDAGAAGRVRRRRTCRTSGSSGKTAPSS